MSYLSKPMHMFFNAPHNEIISLCEYKGTCSRFIRAIAECLICTGVQTEYEFFPQKTRAKPVHLTPLRERLALTPLNLLVLSPSGSLTQSHESRQPPRALPFTAQIQELVEGRAVVAHAFNSSTREAEAGGSL